MREKEGTGIGSSGSGGKGGRGKGLVVVVRDGDREGRRETGGGPPSCFIRPICSLFLSCHSVPISTLQWTGVCAID